MPCGRKPQFLVQVLLDRAADHQPLERVGVHVADRLARSAASVLRRNCSVPDTSSPFAARCSADQAVGIHGAPGGLLQVVAGLHGDRFAADMPAPRCTSSSTLRRNAPRLLLVDSSLHVRLVVAALDLQRSHLDLLDQLALVGVHRVQAIDHVVLVHVGGRVAQGAERVHRAERLLALPFQAAVHALRLVHDQDGPGGPDQVDGLLAAGLLAVLVEVVDILLVDGADRHHHDLDVRAGGEVAHLAELGRVVEEVLEGRVGVEARGSGLR